MKRVTLLYRALAILAILLLIQFSLEEFNIAPPQPKLTIEIPIKEQLMSKYDPERARNERMNHLILQKKILLA